MFIPFFHPTTRQSPACLTITRKSDGHVIWQIHFHPRYEIYLPKDFFEAYDKSDGVKITLEWEE